MNKKNRHLKSLSHINKLVALYYDKEYRCPSVVNLLKIPRFHYIIFIIFLFLLTNYTFAESYRDYRLDDLNYLSKGRKTIQNEGRIETSAKSKNTDKDSATEDSDTKFIYNSFLTSKFYSQKGGDKEDLARRYATQLNFTPEFVGYKRSGSSRFMVLASPIISHRENFQLKRSVNRLVDTEAILAWKLDKSDFSINLEGGRGYQRLDAYGLFFNGMANYFESNFFWKPFGIKFSLIALSYNYKQENFTIRSTLTNDKMFGGNLLFTSIPFISHLQIFNYLILEPGQLAEKEFFQEDKRFKPKGRFLYSGLESKTQQFYKGLDLEFAFFSVTGYRDYAEYWYQHFNTISKTNAFLSYLALNWNLDKYDFRIGGLYSTKDKSNSFNRANNGYSSLVSDVRIFGGKSSFLLMENVNEKNGAIFRDFDSTNENRYDTKGIQLASLGMNYKVAPMFQLTGIINHVNSNLGIGNEGILSGMFHNSGSFSGFLTASVCLARVNPITQKKVIFDELRVDPSIKEFLRFYVSAGLTF